MSTSVIIGLLAIGYLLSKGKSDGKLQTALGEIDVVDESKFNGNTLRWKEDAKRISIKTGVPVEIILTMIRHESNGDKDAVGDSGKSFGLMQLYDPDAKGEEKSLAVQTVANRTNLPFKHPWEMDPVDNIHYGTEYLKILKNDFMDTWYDAIRAYMCGPTDARKKPSCGAKEASKRLDYINITRNV